MIKSLEAREKHDGMAPGAGDRDGVELKVTEAPDNSMRRFAGPRRKARCPRGKTGPLRFEKSGAGERQPPGFDSVDCLH
jgi:hypothetical protein